MNVLVVGAFGGMGRRYCAILKHLGHTPLMVDLNTRLPTGEFDHAIIATPTDDHLRSINEVLEWFPRTKHILCEKPIAKSSPVLLGAFFDSLHSDGVNLYCVNQYQYLDELKCITNPRAPTTYDYYNSGRDGLHWDCYQLYALATGPVVLSNGSPVWKCHINGSRINSRNMDAAYVEMIRDFVGEKKNMWGKDIVLKATEKILEAIK